MQARSLHIFALFGFAVGQPLFDLLSGDAAFLVAHRLRPLDLLVLVAILCLVFPGLPVLVETLTGFLHRRAADCVHQLAAGLLIGAVALQAFKTLFAGPGFALLVAALLVGLPVGWASCRVRLVERFLTFLWPSIVVFPALFLLRPPVSDLLFVERELPALRGGVSSDIPIVLLVFDELPTSSLMDEHQQINAFRYPNFAALARDSHWFRNASTVSNYTKHVLPAILTGRYTRKPVAPTAANYPQNLFTWLAESYELRVFEASTPICPEELCRTPIPGESFEDRVRSTLSDLWWVYVQLILPADLAEGFPSVTATMRDFERAEPRPEVMPLGDLRRRRNDVGWIFSSFVNWIEPTDGPVLYYLHNDNLPHFPYKYLPSGKEYGPHDRLRLPHGLGGYKWGGDEWETIQGFQRHLLQVGYADRLLGTLLTKLRKVGLYDRALIIVVADHGVSFWPNEPHRVAEEKSWTDILAVPLLVKVPYQRTSVVSDRNVEVVDVLPTIADILGAELPWVIDGRSVLESSRPERSRKIFFRQEHDRMERLVSDADLEGVAATIERKISLFGSGEDPRGIYRIGRFRCLAGQKINQAAYAGASDLELELKEEWSFAQVDLDGPFIPAHIVGRINTGRGAAEHLFLAVTVNGRIETVTRTYQGPEGAWSFTAMVPETVFKAGSNQVEVFVISGPEDSPSLAWLRKKGHVSYSLVEARSGREESIVSSTGETIRIVPGAMRGVVGRLRQRRGYTRVSGWAFDKADPRPADQVSVFVDGEADHGGHTALSRRRLAKRLAAPSLEQAGFRIVLSGYIFNRDPPPVVRVFAISASGMASELRYRSEYEDGVRKFRLGNQ